MAGVRVVTDSACDLTEDLAAKNGIEVVPLTIRFGTEELRDRVDLSPDEFWRRCKETAALPETAAPSPGAFGEAYARAAGAGADEVVCITISSEVSATYQSALAAADAASVPVHVIDSRTLTMGQGLVCLAAAELAADGAKASEIVDEVADLITRTRVYGGVGNLDHLQRGGRIGGAKAMLGSLLSIKPVLQVTGGRVEEESRQRTRGRVVSYLVQKARDDAPLERLALASGASDDVDTIAAELSTVECAHPLLVVDLGPVVGTHAGPQTIGIAYIVPRR